MTYLEDLTKIGKFMIFMMAISVIIGLIIVPAIITVIIITSGGEYFGYNNLVITIPLVIVGFLLLPIVGKVGYWAV